MELNNLTLTSFFKKQISEFNVAKIFNIVLNTLLSMSNKSSIVTLSETST